MPTAAILGLTAAGSLAGGLLNRPKTTTQNSSMTRTTPTYLAPLEGGLLQQLTQRMSDPTAGTESIRLAGRNAINQNYAGADQALRDKLLATGDGTSGKYGTAQRNLESSRASSLSGFEGDIASLILGQQNNTLSLAERLLQQGQGTNTTGSSTDPGNIAGGAVQGGLGVLSSLLTLNQFLKKPAAAAPSYTTLGGGGGYAGSTSPGLGYALLQ